MLVARARHARCSEKVIENYAGRGLNCSKPQAVSQVPFRSALCTRLSSSLALALRNFYIFTVSLPSASYESGSLVPHLNPFRFITQEFSICGKRVMVRSIPIFSRLNQGGSSFASCSFFRPFDVVRVGSNSFESRYVLHQEGNLRA